LHVVLLIDALLDGRPEPTLPAVEEVRIEERLPPRDVVSRIFDFRQPAESEDPEEPVGRHIIWKLPYELRVFHRPATMVTLETVPASVSTIDLERGTGIRVSGTTNEPTNLRQDMEVVEELLDGHEAVDGPG